MQTDVLEGVLSCGIFENASLESIERASMSALLIDCKKKQTLSSAEGLWIIASGSVRIYKNTGGARVLLNKLRQGECFGYASMYQDESSGSTTVIEAETACRLLFLSEKDLDAIILKDGNVAKNIIKVLTGKIRFLNGKIDSFTAVSADEKLMKYLLSVAEESSDGSKTVILREKMSHLAEKLNIGRASLYRAFSSLEEKGIIKKEDEKIIIL